MARKQNHRDWIKPQWLNLNRKKSNTFRQGVQLVICDWKANRQQAREVQACGREEGSVTESVRGNQNSGWSHLLGTLFAGGCILPWICFSTQPSKCRDFGLWGLRLGLCPVINVHQPFGQRSESAFKGYKRTQGWSSTHWALNHPSCLCNRTQWVPTMAPAPLDTSSRTYSCCQC